jgi:hypothetical protein
MPEAKSVVRPDVRHERGAQPALRGMSIARILFVHVVIAALALPSLYDTFAAKEHWPYLRYPMYSGVAGPTVSPVYRVFGVTDDDPPAEIRLPERSFAGPLSSLRLQSAFTRLEAGENGTNAASLQAVLRNFLERYETQRLQSPQPLPPLRGLRLYFVDRQVSDQAPGRLVSEFMNAEITH